MANTLDVNIVSANIGALNNGRRILFKIPSAAGGISVLEANVVQAGAGTQSLNLVDLGTAGTSVAGTIGTLGSSVYVAHVPKSFTMANAYVAAGRYVGIEEKNVGTTNTVSIVSVSYVMGK